MLLSILPEDGERRAAGSIICLIVVVEVDVDYDSMWQMMVNAGWGSCYLGPCEWDHAMLGVVIDFGAYEEKHGG